jgi:SHAQKYF class myb-like DNA-binding protein
MTLSVEGYQDSYRTSSNSPPQLHHVARSAGSGRPINEHITPNNTAEQATSTRILLSGSRSTSSTRGEAATEQIMASRLRPAIARSTPTESSEAATSRNTSLQLQLLTRGTPCSELGQVPIQAAVASVPHHNTLPSESSEDSTAEGSMYIDNDKLVPDKKPRRKRTPQVKAGQSCGRWTDEEHQAFLEGLTECGREWKKVAMRIPTRTSAQIRSHAQKYFSKLQRDQEGVFLPNESSTPHNYAGAAAAAIPAEGQREQLAPGVQQNVERILANPSAAQLEVGSTLDALRERYRQLSLRLGNRQEHRRSENKSNSSSRARVVEDEEDRLHHRYHRRHSSSPQHHSRKRALEGATSQSDSHSQNQNRVPNDDHSSVSSNISASVASMGNDELIALHVLGGALSLGSDSSMDDPIPEVARDSDISVASNEEHDDEDLREEEEPTKRPKPNNDD